MIVYFCRFDINETSARFKALPEVFKKRLERITRSERAAQYIFSRLFYGNLCEHLKVIDPIRDFPQGAPHEPIRTNNGLYYTSLSHSGPFFALALSREPVSVDIEVMLPRDFHSLSEMSGIVCEPNALSFYRAWCRHECDIKLEATFRANPRFDFFEQTLRMEPYPVYLVAKYCTDDMSRLKRSLMLKAILKGGNHDFESTQKRAFTGF